MKTQYLKSGFVNTTLKVGNVFVRCHNVQSKITQQRCKLKTNAWSFQSSNECKKIVLHIFLALELTWNNVFGTLIAFNIGFTQVNLNPQAKNVFSGYVVADLYHFCLKLTVEYFKLRNLTREVALAEYMTSVNQRGSLKGWIISSHRGQHTRTRR